MSRVKVYGRLAFAKVNAPEQFQGQGEPRYSASLIVEPNSPAAKKIEAGMLEAARDKWGEKAEKAITALTKQNRVCFFEGDTKPDVQGYEGKMVLNASARKNSPPTLVQSINGENVKLDNASQTTIYSGCYVNMLVDFWAMDNQWGKRINCTMTGIQFVKDGEAFSGGRPADTDDFEIIEDESDDDDTF